MLLYRFWYMWYQELFYMILVYMLGQCTGSRIGQIVSWEGGITASIH
jgi:hypothetical protein